MPDNIKRILQDYIISHIINADDDILTKNILLLSKEQQNKLRLISRDIFLKN